MGRHICLNCRKVSGEKNAVFGKKVLWEKGLLVIERKMFYYSYYQGVAKCSFEMCYFAGNHS